MVDYGNIGFISIFLETVLFVGRKGGDIMSQTEVILILIEKLLQERDKNNQLESEINKRKSGNHHETDVHSH